VFNDANGDGENNDAAELNESFRLLLFSPPTILPITFTNSDPVTGQFTFNEVPVPAALGAGISNVMEVIEVFTDEQIQNGWVLTTPEQVSITFDFPTSNEPIINNEAKFGNRIPNGELTVIKRITNDNGGSLTLADVTLRANGTAVTNGTVNTLEQGTYQVSEDPIADYFVAITGDCDANGFVTLPGGDEKTCTITNNDTGPLPVFITTANSQVISAGNLGAAIDGNLATCTGAVGYRSTGLPFAFFIFDYGELIGGDVSFRYRGNTGTSAPTSFGVLFQSSIDGINWVTRNSTSFFLSTTIEDIDTDVDSIYQFLRVGFARGGGQLTLGTFQICEISVVPKNVVPLAFPQSLSVTSEVPLQITLQGLDEDEGNTLTFSIVDPPQGQLSAIQQVSETSATVTYTSNVGFVALDSFTFKVNDGVFDSQTVTVDINVIAP